MHTPQTTREFAETLPADGWKPSSTGDAYRTAQTRFRINVDLHTALVVLNDESDPRLATQQFAEDMVNAMGGHLSPADMMALMRVLAQHLVTWGQVANRMPRVQSFLQELAAEPSADEPRAVTNHREQEAKLARQAQA